MSPFKLTLLIRAFALLKVPLLGLLRPKVIELSAKRARVRLPLNFIAKNHVGSMYFGALAMGAELSIALKVVEAMQVDKTPVTFIFKDFSCQFVQRAEADTDFYCDEVEQITALIQRALKEGERVEQRFNGYAKLAKGDAESESLMNYQLTLSIKARKKK